MLPQSHTRILQLLQDDDLVLDVGGAANPFLRADWVIDLVAYEQRGAYGGPVDPAAERFGPSSWCQRDLCDRQPWPFSDDQFDFSVCSHTLEDLRDPIFVCQELVRVSKAGYIEVPSRLEEQSFGFQGPWAGWGHHRWLVDLDGDQISFVFKHHVLHARTSDHFPPGFRDSLSPERRVLSLWWEGTFEAHERIFLDAASLDSYLSEFVTSHQPGFPPRRQRRLGRARRQ